MEALAHTVAEIECERVGDMKIENLIDTLPDTLSDVVAKTIADTVSCVEAKAPVKKEADSLVAVEAYTDVKTLKEVKANALFYTQAQAQTFRQVEVKNVTDT